MFKIYCLMILLVVPSIASAQHRFRSNCRWYIPQWHCYQWEEFEFAPNAQTIPQNEVAQAKEAPAKEIVKEAPAKEIVKEVPAKEVLPQIPEPIQEESLGDRAKISIKTLPDTELFCYDDLNGKWLTMGYRIRAFTTAELKRGMTYSYKFKMVITRPQPFERIVTLQFQAGDDVVSVLNEPLEEKK